MLYIAHFLNYIIFKIFSINGKLVSTPSLVLLLLLPSCSMNRSWANTIFRIILFLYLHIIYVTCDLKLSWLVTLE